MDILNNIFVCIILFIIYNYIIIIFLKGQMKIINIDSNEKELKKERKLHNSLSKLPHELINPIAVCKVYLEMLNLDDKEKTAKYVNIIKSEMNRSLSVINDFSSYGKLKKLELEEIDIVYLLEEVKESLLPLFNFNDAYIEIISQEEIYIQADYSRLKQVFINLLKNTLEAKKQDKHLHVKIEIREFKKKIKIRIKDNGIGMDKNTLDHIAELFFTTKENGTGIGIAYSKEVVELHGGTINYKSTINKGTEVLIILPKEKSPKTFNHRN